MNTLKKYKKGGLSVSNKKMKVDPPKGYHWMEEGGRYFLMKESTSLTLEPLSKASFKVATHGKS